MLSGGGYKETDRLGGKDPYSKACRSSLFKLL